MKLDRPLHARTASGTLAKTVTFRRTRKGTAAYRRPLPGKPRSDAQRNHQRLFSLLGLRWKALSPADKQRWAETEQGLRHGPWIAFLSYNIQRLNPAVPDGLAGWWPGVCPFADTLHDLTAYHADAPWYGFDPASGWKLDPQRGGHVLELDGANQRAIVGNPYHLNRDFTALSIAAWVKPLATSTFNPGIIGKTVNTYTLKLNLSHSATLYIRTGSNQVSYTIPLAVWTHVCATFSNNRLRLYANGELKDELDPSQQPSTGTGGTFMIGGTYHVIHARLDDLRFYDRELSQPDAAQLAAR